MQLPQIQWLMESFAAVRYEFPLALARRLLKFRKTTSTRSTTTLSTSSTTSAITTTTTSAGTCTTASPQPPMATCGVVGTTPDPGTRSFLLRPFAGTPADCKWFPLVFLYYSSEYQVLNPNQALWSARKPLPVPHSSLVHPMAIDSVMRTIDHSHLNAFMQIVAATTPVTIFHASAAAPGHRRHRAQLLRAQPLRARLLPAQPRRQPRLQLVQSVHKPSMAAFVPWSARQIATAETTCKPTFPPSKTVSHSVRMTLPASLPSIKRECATSREWPIHPGPIPWLTESFAALK